MTRLEKKEAKRQELISKNYPNAINFNTLKVGQEINGERILSISVGSKNTSVKLGTPKSNYRVVKAQLETIENQPCCFIQL